MAFACNIDRRGQRFRLIVGVVLSVIAVLVFWQISDPGWLRWGLGGGLLAGGLFCIFEGLAGWCAVRALGIKTRL